MEDLKTISIKTQVRRLRYFFLCINFLKKSGSPKIIFQKKLQRWAQENQSDLKKLYSSTGEITENKRELTSQSFKNYLEAFGKFGLSKQINDLLIPTKICITLKALKDVVKQTIEKNNSYELSSYESVQITYVILKQDGNIFITILKQIFDLKEPAQLVDLKKTYKDYYKSHLANILKASKHRNKDSIIEALNRVNSWKNEERYLEDIIPSRLNWMLDIGIIDQELYQNNGKYIFNKKGIEFCESLKLNHIFQHGFDQNYSETQINSLSKLLNDNDFERWIDIDEQNRYRIFKESIYFAVDRFSSLKLPRFSIEQTFLFISLYNLFENKVLIEFHEIENLLTNEVQIENKIFSIRKAARASESYISVRHA